MITEMGSLYASNDPCSGVGYQTAPLLHGTLLKFRIRDNLDCNVTLSLDTLRGGIVVENPALTPTIVFSNLTPFHKAEPVDITPPTPSPMTWASNPAQVAGIGSVTMTATTATDAQTPPVEYFFTCTAGGGHSSSWQASPVYIDSGLVAGTYTYTVKARDSVSPTPNETLPSTALSATVVLDCFPTDAAYATQRVDFLSYKSFGKEPNCWCPYNSAFTSYPTATAKAGSGFQCYGDVDGTTETLSKYRIYNNDYTALVANWKKKISDSTINPCADVDHKYEVAAFKYRVYTNDFNRLVYNWKKKDSNLPRNCPLTDAANAPVNVP